MSRPPASAKIRKGQRWRNKETGLDIEITGTQGERFKTHGCYGTRVSHTITKYDLLKYWEILP